MCELVEVFSVTYKGGDGAAPGGTISVFDGKRGQIIYGRRGQGQTLSSHKPQNGGNDVELLLTGPYRGISADGCVAIEIDLHHGCNNTYVANIHIDVYDLETKYGEAITKVVRTCTCRNSPRAQVKYALLSNAVEAMVEVKLLREQADGRVYGKIIAHSDLGEVVIFKSNNDEVALIGASTTIPLTRSVLAVPLTSSLKIEVDLRIPSTGETVVDSVECSPDLDSEHHLIGMSGKVEVKITCSD